MKGAATGMLRVSTDTSSAAKEVALSGSGQAAANVSGGGCSIVSGDTLADPTLWVLALLAIAALGYRWRARAAQRHPDDRPE